jgi:UDP-glucose 4-epimerase
MTAIDSATEQYGGEIAVVSGAASAGRTLRWRSSTVPATRDLELTLWASLVVAGVAIGAGALTRPHPAASVAFGIAAIALVLAAAILRAVATLTPAAMRPDRPWRRSSLRVAVVGTNASALDLHAALHDGGVAGVEVVGAISPGGTADGVALGTLEQVHRIIGEHRIGIVLVGPGVSRHAVIDVVMRTCEGDPVRVCDLTEFYEDVFGHVPITDVDSAWFQHVLHPRFRDRPSQRIVDIVVASVLGLATLPIVVIAALLIRRDGGPAVFRQTRIGRDGRPFVMFKLRTMGRDEGSMGWTLDGDQRITPIGRVLRRLHIDELPQLINVLRGDMTLVGPRPEQPDIVDGLGKALPMWRGRHRYKPGLTGWAQVRCGYAGSHDGSARKLAHDLYYLRHHSLALDAAIVAQTARLLVLPRENLPTPFLDRRDEAPNRITSPAGRVRPRIARPRAVVTGGAGFIGSHLVDNLVDAGHDVLVLDDLSSGRPANLACALSGDTRLETADVTDADEVRRLFTAVRPHVVYHLAAQIETTRAVAEPLHDAKANVVGTLAVLEAARACGARRFVLASSGGAVYGDAEIIPTPENAALAPQSPYGAAKIAAEYYTALYGRLYGLSVIALRLANVYGPRQGGSGEGGVVARFCRARLDEQRALVFGDGRQTRDYVHVEDVAAAFAAAGAGDATGAVNVGTRMETSVLDLVRMLGLLADFRPARAGEVGRSCLDASAAPRVLGWRPRIALETGLEETLAWMDGLHDEHAARAV